MRLNSPKVGKRSYLFWVLVLFLILVFLTGGGARADIESLTVLRPAAVVALALGLWGLTREQITAHRFVFSMTAAIFALIILHLLPLPPIIWRNLPGHDIVREIDRVAKLGAVWRPLSLVPMGTWNAFYALVVPLATLVLTVRITREERFQLLIVLLLLIGASGFMGLLQIIGPPDSALYFYAVTNNGTAVGLFANRNHQAVMLACLFPMLAIYASAGLRSIEQVRFRGWVAFGFGLVLIPLLLVTGSRAGLIIGLIGLLVTIKLYKRPAILTPTKRKAAYVNPKYIWGGVSVVALALLTVVMSRAEAIQRLLQSDELHGDRLAMWSVGWGMFGKYFPTGSGFGSIIEAFQIDEPRALLDPAYTNHLHNDWLEVLVCGGLPAALLLGIACYAWGHKTAALLRPQDNQRREYAYARLGALIILMLALASIADYPLRVPSISCVFAIAVIWLSSWIEPSTDTNKA
jgi:hypothetical protein